MGNESNGFEARVSVCRVSKRSGSNNLSIVVGREALEAAGMKRGDAVVVTGDFENGLLVQKVEASRTHWTDYGMKTEFCIRVVALGPTTVSRMRSVPAAVFPGLIKLEPTPWLRGTEVPAAKSTERAAARGTDADSGSLDRLRRAVVELNEAMKAAGLEAEDAVVVEGGVVRVVVRL